MEWNSNSAGAKPRRKIKVCQTDIEQDDGTISMKQMCPILGENQTKIVLKFSNLAGYPLQEMDKYVAVFI